MDSAVKAQALVARCAAIDWRKPAHNPRRAIAAYQHWLGHLALRRSVRWVSDPDEVASERTVKLAPELERPALFCAVTAPVSVAAELSNV